MEIIYILKKIVVLLSFFQFSMIQAYACNIFPIPQRNLTITAISLPKLIILDTLSQSDRFTDNWIIQLRPDPFFDGIRIKPTIQKATFSWALKTVDGFELAKRVVKHPEAKLNLAYLSTGTYILELSSGSEISSLLLAKY